MGETGFVLRWRWLLGGIPCFVALLAAAGTSCSSSSGTSGSSFPDGGSTSDGTAGSDVTPDASPDTPLGADGGSGDGGSFDAAASGPDSEAGLICPLPDVPDGSPSLATVTFVVTSASGATRYVLASGARCSPFAIESEAGTGIQLVPSQWGCCECVDAGSQATFLSVGADASVQLTWDGREALPYTTYELCTAGSPPWCATVFGASVRRALPPGDYTVAVPYFADVPEAGCTGSATGFTCQYGDNGGLCGATSQPMHLTATQGFMLPPAGTTTVLVEVP